MGFTLHIKAIEAADIPKVDLTGWADPYLKIKLGETKAKTAVKQKTGSPVWNEEFHFDIDRPDGSITISVWDETRMGNREISEDLQLGLRQFADGKVYDKWFDLKHGKSKAGRAHCLIQITPRGAPAWIEVGPPPPKAVPQKPPSSSSSSSSSASGEQALNVAIGVETAGGGTLRLFEKGSEVPKSTEQTVTTTYDKETSVTVRLIAGNHWLAAQNVMLGELSLSGLPELLRREARILIKASLDSDAKKLKVSVAGEGTETVEEEFEIDLSKVKETGDYESEKAQAESQEAATRMDSDLKSAEALEDVPSEFVDARQQYRQWLDSNKTQPAQDILDKTVEMNDEFVKLYSDWKIISAAAGGSSKTGSGGAGGTTTKENLAPLDVKYPTGSSVNAPNGVGYLHFFSDEADKIVDIQITEVSSKTKITEKWTEVVSDAPKGGKIEHYARIVFQRNGQYEVAALVGDPNGPDIDGKKKANAGKKLTFNVSGAPGEKKSLTALLPPELAGRLVIQDESLEPDDHPEAIVKLDSLKYEFTVRYDGPRLVVIARPSDSEDKIIRPRLVTNTPGSDKWQSAKIRFVFPEEGAYRVQIATDGKKAIAQQWVVTGDYKPPMTEEEKAAFAA